jgi:hypothetical protein
MTFGYTTPAELVMAKRKGGSRQPLVCRRFIRFAVEEFAAVHTLGAWLQIGDARARVARKDDNGKGRPVAVRGLGDRSTA